MKKIINRKRYDTSAKTTTYIVVFGGSLVGSFWNGFARNDFNWCEEHLYRTANGNWFLHGMSGPMGKYCRSDGFHSSSGEDIVPLTEDEAYKWLEENDLIEALEQWFSVEDA